MSPAGLSAPVAEAYLLFIPVFPAPGTGPGTKQVLTFNSIQPIFFQSMNKVKAGGGEPEGIHRSKLRLRAAKGGGRTVGGGSICPGVPRSHQH